MKIVYAHTDSLYIPIPSVEKAEEIKDILNKYVQEKIFPNVMGLDIHPIELEFEKYYSILGVGTTKNKNAGYIVWKDGIYLSEPEFVCTGFSMKKIAESNTGKKVQKKTIEMWINQKTEEEIVSYVKSKYNAVLDKEISKEDLVKRKRIQAHRLELQCSRCRKKYKVDYLKRLLNLIPDSLCENERCNARLNQCKTLEGKRPTFSGGSAGQFYYNEHINPDNKLTDSFYYLKCKLNGETYTDWNGKRKPASYVGVRHLPELDNFNPDWVFLAESEIIKKVKPIFDAMNWDMSKCKIDDKQKLLKEWF
tara:strand:- start:23 stop:943 length:921 start_codon:yes stop_codon:yes gene_type:complete